MNSSVCRGFATYTAKELPRCNCIPCWDKFFMTQVARTFTAVKAMEQFGIETVSKVQGDKFLKHLQRFLQTPDGQKLK